MEPIKGEERDSVMGMIVGGRDRVEAEAAATRVAALPGN